MTEQLVAEAKLLEEAGASLLDFQNSGPIVGPAVVAGLIPGHRGLRWRSVARRPHAHGACRDRLRREQRRFHRRCYANVAKITLEAIGDYAPTCARAVICAAKSRPARLLGARRRQVAAPITASMSEMVPCAVKTGPSTTELREFKMPEIDDESAILKVEVAGICGSDVKNYKGSIDNVIMGHENVGRIYKAGKKWLERKGLKEGDLVFLEHYLPCTKCEWCHKGEYRHCFFTDWHHNPGAIRYGYTTSDIAPHLWGGFAHYLYMPWNAVCHKVPDGVSAELAGIGTPMANGVQWTLFEAGIGYGSKVLDSRARASRVCAKSSPRNRPAPI